ncbi:MAG: ATP-dependent zinc metalloprotease FtsH, partial [candidate division WWE3 bacterium GW2011_GWB1_41_6]
PWVAREMGEAGYSQEMAAKVDNEIKNLIDDAHAKAKRILMEKREILDRISQRLLEKETIDKDEYDAILSARADSFADTSESVTVE